MRDTSPFLPDDLAELGALLDQADDVVSMGEIACGDSRPGVIGLRHDVDNVIVPAVELAEWESARGYRSTYFILDGNGRDDHYWYDKTLLRTSLERIAGYGHEIGYHCNAIARAVRDGREPLALIAETLDELRGYGFDVVGTVAHGDPLCHRYGFVNDEVFSDSPRPSYGAADRAVTAAVRISPVARATFGLEYDANWLPRADYLSDSGGRWSQPFETVAAVFPPAGGQLHMLVHPDWWAQAFAGVTV